VGGTLYSKVSGKLVPITETMLVKAGGIGAANSASDVAGAAVKGATTVTEKFVLTDSRATKIFGTREGHILDTPANRDLMTSLANDPALRLGPDIHGNVWSAKMLPDGSQAWVQTRNGQIWNAGVNATPHTYNPKTGLAAPVRPGWK
jgi:filamentous hemagglutinin